MVHRTAVDEAILRFLADGEWHQLAQIAQPLWALADRDLCVAIAVGCIGQLRDMGYEIEEGVGQYRLVIGGRQPEGAGWSVGQADGSGVSSGPRPSS